MGVCLVAVLAVFTFRFSCRLLFDSWQMSPAPGHPRLFAIWPENEFNKSLYKFIR